MISIYIFEYAFDAKMVEILWFECGGGGVFLTSLQHLFTF